MSPDRGRFIVFEGGDGAGKSTQVRALASWLEAASVDHLVTREPGGTWLGERIRELVLNPESGPIGSRAETLLYLADKAQHVDEVIEPALQSGRSVVCDRYVDSLLAYQGGGRDQDGAELAQVAGWATGQLRPDLTVVLDIEPDQGVHQMSQQDRIEAAGADFHQRVRSQFLTLARADPDRYLVLPARRSRSWITAQVRARVAALLGIQAELSDPQEMIGR